MKIIKHLFFILILCCCKEKTFADDIVLFNNSDIKMKFQNFNEGLDENSSSLIFVGKHADTIPLKYYTLYPKPPEIYFLKSAKEKKDSIARKKILSLFFNDNFNKIIRTEENIKFDSLSKENLEIFVKSKDTIPHYALDSTNKIKAYKAYPVFIRNISGKNLKMAVNQFPGIVILNKEKKWQIIKNDNFYVCGNSIFRQDYWVLKPNEIIIYAFNHFQGKKKSCFKIGLTPSFLSEEFDGNINPKVLEKQRNMYLIE